MAKSHDNEDDATMHLFDHLAELRRRLLVCVGVFAAIFFACFIRPFGAGSANIADVVFAFLQKPLADIIAAQGGRMIFTALHEGFFTQVKISFFTAFFVAFPVILLQVWRFIAPGLYRSERHAALPFLIATPVLFFLGGAMVYYIVIPLVWQFFESFQHGAAEGVLAVELEPRISEYLSLVMRLIFAFGLAFELPVALLLMAKAGLVTAAGLAQKRRYAIVAAFIAGAILTPPDVISQVLLALPIIVLYELSIIAIRMLVREKDNA